MNLIEDLEKAWEEAEPTSEFQSGDVVILKDVRDITVFTVESPFIVSGPSTFRRHSKAPVVVGGDVFALIAEYEDDPKYGRHIFTRSPWKEGVWVDEEGAECTLDELQNIRAAKDEGEYL